MYGTILIILSSVLWGALHSLLASHSVKELSRRTFGEWADRAYRFVYNVFALVSFLPVMALAGLLPDRALYTIPAPWMYAMLAGQFAALIMLVVGVLQTDTLAFIGISQLVGRESKPELVTSGLYRWVRHPLYTAGLLFLWLTPSMTLNRLTLYACLTVYIIIGAYFEEKKLLRDFGKEYEDYRSRTPMLIPFFL